MLGVPQRLEFPRLARRMQSHRGSDVNQQCCAAIRRRVGLPAVWMIVNAKNGVVGIVIVTSVFVMTAMVRAPLERRAFKSCGAKDEWEKEGRVGL